MSTAEHRKHIPVGLKLHAVLLLLGFTEDEINGGIQWDHFPALVLRVADPVTGELVPPANDPRYIRPLRTAEHAIKTFGRGATTAGSDIGEAARLKRLARKTAEYQARLLAKEPGKPRPKSTRWPRRSFGRKAKRMHREAAE